MCHVYGPPRRLLAAAFHQRFVSTKVTHLRQGDAQHHADVFAELLQSITRVIAPAALVLLHHCR